MPTSIRSLRKHTREFFRLHWNDQMIGEEIPAWSKPWDLTGPAPNHNRQGVYAFIKDDLVTYIGSGISRGKKGYEGYGLGMRIGGYVKLEERGQYRAVNKRLADAGSLITIGFPAGYGYLAIALEYYLLARIPSEHNVQRAGS